MYFVDREHIEKILLYIDQLLEMSDNHPVETFADQLYLERTVHILAEAFLDTGNLMIDGFIMRDPGGFEDIINILIDEEVLPKDDKNAYAEIIKLRKTIVKDYLNIDHQQLNSVLEKYKSVFKQFSIHIRTYLDNELGVANAFYNQ